ncbi:type VI secretion system baseplate subunit TssF [Pendulispora rubella]|uniref:Type VI secretion system baseplate subunit TssF n=1 Tax=Pendulispora rubella TaxID=2741070 RepID=A0ABZ2KV47_9BACT
MSHDFSRELEAIASLSKAFAAAHPALAPGLAAPSDDPDVERLIDGFQYLVQQVEELIDSAAKRAADPFAEILSPELLRPFPCAAILEMAAADRPTDVPAGTEFLSIPVEGVRCPFRAFAASRVVPWEVADAKLVWGQERPGTAAPSRQDQPGTPSQARQDHPGTASQARPGGQSLRVVFRRRTQTPHETLASLFPLRLHLAGEPRSSFGLLLALSTVESIEITAGESPQSPSLRLPGTALRMWGVDADEALLPPEPWEHAGFRLVREYFLLPAKFAFVELSADGANETALATSLGPAQTVSITFQLGRALPANLSVTRESLRTNCVPVVNVFETTAEPVRPGIERPSHVLRPAGLAPDHGEVYGVLGAEGWCADRNATMPIPPLTDFEALAQVDAAPKGKIFYAIGRSPRALQGNGQKEDTSVRFVLPREANQVPPVKSVSFDLLATNRDLPMVLGVGDIKVSGGRTPKNLVFRNITAVTPYRAPPGGRPLQRRSLAMVAVSASSRRQGEVLRTLLHLLNLHTTVNGPPGLTALRRIRAVVDVASTMSILAGEHGMRQGSDIDIRLDEAGLDGEGDAYVFASVLARLFAHDVKINSFARTRARFEGTGRTVSFPARTGDETI